MKIQRIEQGGITSPAGFSAGAVYVGVKSHKSYKPDVAILLSDRPAACAALFTTNRFCAAPVILGRETAARGEARGAVINSGNANAGTGKAGLEAARAVRDWAEEQLHLPEGSLFVSSTGVIGERFPTDKVKDAVTKILPRLSPSGGSEAAWAIMTTDRKRKETAVEISLKDGPVRIGVMAKGSGMIHPNMATTLCFISCDARLEAPVMRAMLWDACEESFHALTVDGDTSTNDSLIFLANGASGIAPKDPEDEALLKDTLRSILLDMARRIAADGEGAEKTLTVRVQGLKSEEEARRVARAVTKSNTVKAALGRGDLTEALILTAAGSAESNGDFDKVFCAMDVEGTETIVLLDFHDGPCRAEAFGCDLTGEYVRLNGDYRT